jgi:hypothetical protein
MSSFIALPYAPSITRKKSRIRRQTRLKDIGRALKKTPFAGQTGINSKEKARPR